MAYNGTQNHLGVNLVYTKFLFVTPARDDDELRARTRVLSTSLARGFINEFESNGKADAQTVETIQFLVAEGPRPCVEGLLSATHVAQVSAKYRPRLDHVEAELRRRLGDLGTVRALDGAVQGLRYTSAEMHAFAYKDALGRRPGRAMPNVIIAPMNKTPEWWSLSPLERHVYFYPHADPHTGQPAKGHAMAAAAGVSTIFRRLYHNPDGYQRPSAFDFLTYFECSDEHLATFDTIRMALRDEAQNPEWRFVIEGPEWRGRRTLWW